LEKVWPERIHQVDTQQRIKSAQNNFHLRYDYEDVDASGANLMMTYLEPQIPGYIGMTLKANEKEFVVAHADNYEYVDPVDGSVAKNQVIY
jgi:phosphoglucomutase